MKILLGISASIAAYKLPDIVHQLTVQGHDVHVVMTQHATQFVTPFVLETLSHHPVMIEVMEEKDSRHIQHIDLAQSCDVFAIVPASANIIGKLAHGIADDLLSTMALAVPATTKKFIAPAMNTVMYQNPAVTRNIRQLQDDGYQLIEPRTSLLACGVEGKGAMASVDTIIQTLTQSTKK